MTDPYGLGSIRNYQVGEAGLVIATGRVEAKLDRLLAWPYADQEHRKLAQHLEKEKMHLLTFLRCPGLAATNHEAERALRGLVIARKVWGGSRTARGARTQSVLMSVLRTCRQQEQAALPHLIRLQQMRQGVVPVLVDADVDARSGSEREPDHEEIVYRLNEHTSIHPACAIALCHLVAGQARRTKSAVLGISVPPRVRIFRKSRRGAADRGSCRATRPIFIQAD